MPTIRVTTVDSYTDNTEILTSHVNSTHASKILQITLDKFKSGSKTLLCEKKCATFISISVNFLKSITSRTLVCTLIDGLRTKSITLANAKTRP